MSSTCPTCNVLQCNGCMHVVTVIICTLRLLWGYEAVPADAGALRTCVGSLLGKSSFAAFVEWQGHSPTNQYYSSTKQIGSTCGRLNLSEDDWQSLVCYHGWMTARSIVNCSSTSTLHSQPDNILYCQCNAHSAPLSSNSKANSWSKNGAGRAWVSTW